MLYMHESQVLRWMSVNGGKLSKLKGEPMSDSSENLLGSIPTGEEIHDPREGDHQEARLTYVEVIEQSNGHALKLTYNNMVDSEGRSFEYQERYTIPTSTSEQFIQGMFLNLCHELGIIPRTQKRCPLFDDVGHRSTLEGVFNSKIGSTVPLRLKIDDKSGYMRSRILRPKKAA
jgi:hypothetical protein